MIQQYNQEGEQESNFTPFPRRLTILNSSRIGPWNNRRRKSMDDRFSKLSQRPEEQKQVKSNKVESTFLSVKRKVKPKSNLKTPVSKRIFKTQGQQNDKLPYIDSSFKCTKTKNDYQYCSLSECVSQKNYWQFQCSCLCRKFVPQLALETKKSKGDNKQWRNYQLNFIRFKRKRQAEELVKKILGNHRKEIKLQKTKIDLI